MIEVCGPKILKISFVRFFFLSFIGDGFQDAKDSEWTNDSKLEPVDLNKLDARKFIVYKFGCFVSELVSAHCQHAPVTLLLADKIPPNERLRNNPYRNSFFFDANNSILYIRTARLDTVGEFTVVLVHTLAHIKAGEMILYTQFCVFVCEFVCWFYFQKWIASYYM